MLINNRGVLKMMKKMLKFAIPLLVLLVALPFVYGFDVSIKTPSVVDYSNVFYVNIVISPGNETAFDVVALLPTSWEITNWTSNVGNIFAEHRNTQYLGEDVSAFRWKFNNINQNVTLTAKVLPKSVGKNRLMFVWTYPQGFNSNEFMVNVKTVCGNNICEPGENIFNCPADCQRFPQMFWVVVLLIATGITIAGIMYREYKKLEKKGRRTSKRRRKKR